ncbi:hypothetical protein EHQ12_03235 [Leptospira gomenensis]|uniref:Uncharacterized protein n=1 Tax=Leptospira gomenensis TaxID=2484974 RepID=A0A5F1Z185_9LEPT|nr:hypothetical protein [Leptospira gomenensis]TGK31071.1 hypothetical protein EHQ17_15270 [Leptospira gomenensis]TGK43275.1 hypothetical protein EHQ12_03235 [Leptospira gomenensis]TGK45210.1 hypothetical protein EHQ07_09730 [Leptospira gomenensis]TGK66124.1 hypothetical protein EHQ13_03465 [Leptospira gomenensis]
MEDTELEKRSRENVLKIGYCSLDEIEEKVKAFRVMNQNAAKKRYLITREPVLDNNGKPLLAKAAEIDISAAKLLRRHFKGSQMFKTFQPDEGIVIISDMTSAEGVSFTMDIVTQIMNLGGGAYEGFIDRVDSFGEFINLLKKSLFPKLIIIGYIPQAQVQSELLNFVRVKRVDNYLRSIELSHSLFKPHPYFPKIKQVEISQHDPKSWGRFVVEIIREYTRPYLLEEI